MLKWTYVFAYFLEDEVEKNLFEFLQEDLEKNTEHLNSKLTVPLELEGALLRAFLSDDRIEGG